jgi:G3E family GTPase
MTTKSRIPVTLVTGFLGSGKTTFINAGLRAPELQRTVVVVNEFGEVGLDHQLFAASSDAIVVLENGCLCCTVRGDLITTLNDLFQRRQAGNIPEFDRVVIETSGLAEPGPVLQAFLSEPTLDGLYRVAEVLTLVDAVNFAGTIIEHDEALRQVALADTILVSKLDLVTGDRAAAEARITATLRRHNPSAHIAPVDTGSAAIAARLAADGFDAANAKADPRRWLAADVHAHPHAHHHDHDGHDHDHTEHSHFSAKGIESFVLIRDKPLARAELQFLLDGISQNLGPSMLRVKGLVNIVEEPGRPAVIQGAQHLLHTMTWLERWPDADERTRVVFITQGLIRRELEEMIALLDRMSQRTFAARERGRLAREAAEKL